MKLSEFKKMSPEKRQWELVENDFNLCLKCGHTTQTEKSIARILQEEILEKREDVIQDFQEAMWDNE